MATAKYQSAGTHTFTAPAGVRFIQVEAWGGGGGGCNGGGNPDGGDTSTGGGGGGAYSKKLVYPVTPGTGYTVFVGNGGGIQAHAQDTYFVNSSTVLAKGGLGGNGSVAGTGGQASACVGDVKYSGGNGSFGDQGAGGGAAGPAGNGNGGSGETGGRGNAGTGGLGGAAGTTNPSNNGGASELGGGGGGGSGNNLVGGTGGIYGGGGGAGEDNGGAGARGQVIITYTQSDIKTVNGKTTFKNFKEVIPSNIKTFNGTA